MSKLRLKVENNTREHFSVLPCDDQNYSLKNNWFSNSTAIPVYSLEELLGTKLRALYQRKKGRDLFDLAEAIDSFLPHSRRPYDMKQAFKKVENKIIDLLPGESWKGKDENFNRRFFD